MSDMSTTLSMNGKSLFSENEVLMCSIYNVKMFLFVFTILICICSISILSGSLIPVNKLDTELFSNNEFIDLKEQIGYASYQSCPLTSNNNLIFGQANRYIQPIDSISKEHYVLDIYANLYVINGNPFGEYNKNIHRYIVYLKETKTLERKEIGELKKDGDGLYKLNFKSTEPVKYIKYNEVEIIYKTMEKELSVLNGKFSIL